MLHHSILETLPRELQKEAVESIKVMRFPPGQILFHAGEHCKGLPLMLSGAVKVQMTGVSGNSIVLYRMGADDICTLSIGCLMTGYEYRAEAFVEEASEAAMVPRGLFDRLMDQSAAFRRMDERLED